MKPIIDKKYYSLIWIGLLVSSVVRSCYSLYTDVISIMDDPTQITVLSIVVDTIVYAIVYAIIPAALCYFCASIVYSFGARRRFFSVNRGDFIYLTMLYTAGARLVMGVIEAFAILDATVFDYTSVLLDVTVLSSALYFMYMKHVAPRLAPKDNRNVFGVYSMTYLICQAVHTGIPCLAYFIGAAISNSDVDLSAFDSVVDVDVNALYEFNVHAVVASVLAIVVLLGFVVLSLVLSKKFEKMAKDLDDSNRHDGGNPFVFDESLEEKKEDEKVFEEFDI